MQRIRIRTKLLAALSVPLLMIVFVATVSVRRSNNDTRRANADAALVQSQVAVAKAAIGPGSLVRSFLDTRSYYGGWMIGAEQVLKAAQGDSIKDVDPEDNETVNQRLREAIEHFRQSIKSAPAPVQTSYDQVLTQIDSDLPKVEQDIAGAKSGSIVRQLKDAPSQQLAVKVFQGYTDIISSLLNAGTSLAMQVIDPDLRRGADLLDLANRRSDLELRILVAIGAAAGLGTPPGDQALIEARENLSETYGILKYNIEQTRARSIDDYASAAAPDFDASGKAMVVSALDGGYDNNSVQLGQDLVSLGSKLASEGTGSTHSVTADAATQVLSSHADQLITAAKAKAHQAAADADRARLLSILGALFAALVTFLASMSITRPLRKLTQQAEEMATFKLPNAVQEILNTPLGEDVIVPDLEPIYVNTRDEVRDVAAALNVVQESAVGLAVEQAVLRRNIADSFVNLGRRNQNLIGRQLDFITELERNEADPETLDNLFKLDHLATRMRRNAESLLVLAGLEPPRQWSAPVDVANIIRAALAEVEGYQRVQQRHLDPATVAGSAAADLAHVLAELIENALVFSPPESAVEVFGRAGTSAYTLSVVDQGIGMSPEQLAEANSRLAGTESFTVAPSRYLGHYVAGHLARRVGVGIDLFESPSGGVAVRINIPGSLLASQAREYDRPGFAPNRSRESRAAVLPQSPAVPAGEPSAAQQPASPIIGNGLAEPVAATPPPAPVAERQYPAVTAPAARQDAPQAAPAEAPPGPSLTPGSLPSRVRPFRDAPQPPQFAPKLVPAVDVPVAGSTAPSVAGEPILDAPQPGELAPAGSPPVIDLREPQVGGPASVERENAAAGTEAPESVSMTPVAGTTPGGLKRRVKGASSITAPPTVINRRAAESEVAEGSEPNRTDVFRFLSGFQGASDSTSNGDSK